MKSDFTAFDFLDPSKFHTKFDTCAKCARRRYLDAREQCDDYSEITIAIDDTVSARLKVSNGHARIYERLGHTAYSCELLRAILDSGCPVWVYRMVDGKIEKKHQLCQGV